LGTGSGVRAGHGGRGIIIIRYIILSFLPITIDAENVIAVTIDGEIVVWRV